MKTIFDTDTLHELIHRITLLTPKSRAQWGKMDVFQMLRHCTMNEELFLGKKKYERLFIGRLFGKMALNSMLKNNEPLKKNMATHSDFKIKGTGDVEAEKQKWIQLLKEYPISASDGFRNFIHPFFGEMTKEQIGCCVYKHTDHHLRQFGNG